MLSAAKNLILAGVKSVTLHDEGTVELWDLSSNFIFSESDVGKNRALASIQKLQDLNNAVAVRASTTTLAKEQLSDFQVLPVLCNFLLIYLLYACLSDLWSLSLLICWWCAWISICNSTVA